MFVNISINPQKITKDIIKFIKETVNKAGFSKAIVGLSGGIDSAVSCVLAIKALGVDNVFVGLFPYGNLNTEGTEDAQSLMRSVQVPLSNINLIDIKPLVDPVISINNTSDQLRKGNIMVRMRMILLYDLAKKHQALVLGTENRTEHLLGYFTRFGDEASDLEPIRHLYKTQIWQLAKFLKIPQKIIDKTPTAGLWTGQTDEGDFGFSYEDADKILHLYIDLKKRNEEIVKNGYKKEIVEKVINRLQENEFKHRLPYTVKLD